MTLSLATIKSQYIIGIGVNKVTESIYRLRAVTIVTVVRMAELISVPLGSIQSHLSSNATLTEDRDEADSALVSSQICTLS